MTADEKKILLEHYEELIEEAREKELRAQEEYEQVVFADSHEEKKKSLHNSLFFMNMAMGELNGLLKAREFIASVQV